MRLILVLALMLFASGIEADNLRLWYSAPARNWWEALPVGNAHIGAMVYGGAAREEIQLNEETFVEKIVVHSRIGGTLRLRSYVPLKCKGLKKAKGECPNMLYASANVLKPIISEELSSPEKPELRNVYEYDLKTVAGKDYVITNK